jgi:hypothetical protein
MVEFSTILSFIQATGIIVGVAYYILNIQNNRKNQELALKAQENALESRNTQFFLQLYNLTSEYGVKLMFSDETWDNPDEWLDKHGPTNDPDGFSKWFMTMNAMEMWGLLVKRGFVELELVDDIMSSGILILWDKYEAVVQRLRKLYGVPQLLEYQEYLVDEIRIVVDKQHPDYTGRLKQ